MPRVLLVVDDEPEIRAMVKRLLGRSFDEVHLSGCEAEAEFVLAARPVTHVLADMFLGPDEKLGCELVSHWRKRFSSIQWAALFTGSNIEMSASYEGVDAIYTKPMGFLDLFDELKRPAR